MSEDDELLASSQLTTRGPLDLEALTAMFSQALIHHNPSAKITVLQSLVDTNDEARVLPCPRDSENSYVILDGQIRQGFSCCDVCINQLDCYVLGVTKQFLYAKKVRK